MCYTAGLKPEEMFDCTTDELVNVYKGKVEEWRVQRSFTNLMVRCWADKEFDIYDHIPLPFDDEIREAAKQADSDEMLRIYNEAKEKW